MRVLLSECNRGQIRSAPTEDVLNVAAARRTYRAAQIRSGMSREAFLDQCRMLLCDCNVADPSPIDWLRAAKYVLGMMGAA